VQCQWYDGGVLVYWPSSVIVEYISMSTEPTDSARFRERYQHMLGETAQIPWQDLQLFYAKGNVIKVQAGADLVEVATRISLDAEQAVAAWIDQGLVQKVEDSDARDWFATSTELWAVVVSPWVLVQAKEQAKG
jgi:hypothetical protein